MVYNNPLVSIIIPTFNRANLISESISSVLNQTFQDFEIIIVNPGSTDEATNAKLKKYQAAKTKVVG